MFETYFSSINSNYFSDLSRVLLIVVPIILPIALFIAFWKVRFRWLTMKFVEAQAPCLLEIRLPKEITKSPAAMEIFFSHLNPGGAGNWGEAYLDGKTRAWFSFEIASIGGQIRFFMWTSNKAKYKNLMEAQLYGQYPNIEIYEVTEDYTKDFYHDPEKFSMFGVQYALLLPDPFPIKTYIDYGLDKDQKDEYKVDPITAVIEFFGSLKQGENAWLQILIQKQEAETWEHGVLTVKSKGKKDSLFTKLMIFFFGKSKDLKAELQAEIKKIKESTMPELPEGADKATFRFPNPTKGQTEVIAALERSGSKTAYDCMIRSIYITEKNTFNPAFIGGLLGNFKQYGSLNLNSFKLGMLTDVSDARKDLARILPFVKTINDKEISMRKEDLLYAYKLRSYFQGPYKNYGKQFLLPFKHHEYSKPFVLTTEELATIFHFPSGMVSQTPTLQRVESKKSEAPANLPV